jgi:hypothetical protein
MKKQACLFLFLICVLSPGIFGQNLDEILKEAGQNFDKGEFGMVIRQLNPYRNTPNRSDRARVHLLLAETYLTTGRYDAADSSMRTILRATPGIEMDPDNPDMLQLYNSFRTEPVLFLSLGGGPNITRAYPYANYGIGNTSEQSGVYTDFTYGFQVGAGISVALARNLELGVELYYFNKKYLFRDSLLTNALSSPAPFSLEFTEIQSWIDVPVMFTYTYRPKSRNRGIFPFVSAGLTYNYLFGATLKGLQRSARGGDALEPFTPIADDDRFDLMPAEGLPLRRRHNFSATVGAGAKLRIGATKYLALGFRYNVGFRNLVETQNRYSNPDLIYRFGYIDNDFRIDNLSATLSFIAPVYFPKKKKVRQPFLLPQEEVEVVRGKPTTDITPDTILISEGLPDRPKTVSPQPEGEFQFDEGPDGTKPGKTGPGNKPENVKQGKPEEAASPDAETETDQQKKERIRKTRKAERKKMENEIMRELKREVNYEINVLMREAKNKPKRELRKLKNQAKSRIRKKTREILNP